MYDHEREAERGFYSRKCQRIRDIVAAGARVSYRIVERFADEAAAYDAERRRIEHIGLKNLTNVQRGGVMTVREVEEFLRPTRLLVYRPWTTKMVERLAPSLRRSIALLLSHGGLEFHGIDLTDDILAIIKKMYCDIGREQFRAILKGTVP